MTTIKTTERFDAWLSGLKNIPARVAIARRLDRAAHGNYGDHKRFDGIVEFRIDMGPGYRIYAVERGATLIIVMVGGDKKSQRRDIKAALEIAKGLPK